MLIVVVSVALAGLAIYFLIVFLRSNTKRRVHPNANLEKSPEEMPMPSYRPFKDGPFQMTMGLRTLDMHEWIEIDRYYRPQIQLKAELLASSRRQEIFVCKDEAFAGAKEALEMLFDFLPQQFPNMFQGNPSRTKITNLITGRTFDLSDMHQTHPLEIAANLVQEDLVIMQRDAEQETYQANALAVCFPSGWLPESKLGLPLASIHVPFVPFYQEKLRASMDRYFLKLKVDSPVQRANWTIQVGDNLCHTSVEGHEHEVITKENAGRLVHLRVERQTLRRLPKSDTILFTIKTYLRPVQDVCQNEPDTAKRLAGAVRNWPAEMRRYKGADQYDEGLLAYLDSVSSSSS